MRVRTEGEAKGQMSLLRQGVQVAVPTAAYVLGGQGEQRVTLHHKPQISDEDTERWTHVPLAAML